ncbi:glycoside hydrolase family 3 N-terminal domain-containing protein [Pedobacter sp.]|jgi:beta-glucosidase|uniref:glycoside hydrolase family 3 N-terminal domain-containing protein n=1 Tax=Pedobacter sp. TaxID=1411316 RepID=UPI002C403CC8|nr:glycoside hydrolase family 3 N-terminal domain-containing protein [Pedobacter sp.]HWW38964.1 glycoside hydrolase family 3 N-terminal domain-containing protein [Pedobacter sp.]
MNHKKSLIPILLFCSVFTAEAQNSKEAKVEALLKKMTLEEKVGQMAQITLDVIGKGKDRFTSYEPFTLDQKEMEKALVQYKIGSVLNTSNNRARTTAVWYDIIGKIQKVAMSSKNRIPVIYGIDGIHGETYTAGATMFPQEIGQAATFNRKLVREGAEISAYETRASSIPWTFSPQLDLGPDPRFPRQQETFGEDPYLAGELGKAMVKGFEGENNDVSNPFRVATSVKHFLGYQSSISGKDRTPAVISDQALREYHLPPFKAAIDAGAKTIMINSGLINGVPVHANYEILTKMLKEELGFKGLVVTDWGDIENLYARDHVAKNNKDAVRLAINAGIDMSMIAYNYEPFCDDLIALVKEGQVKEERINDAVRRILMVKYDLNLFEKPTTNPKDYPKFGSPAFEKAAYNTAAESITLLKNTDQILPLSKSLKVLVTGPNANSMRTLNGAWTYSWQGEKVEEFAAKYNTILKAIQRKAGQQNVSYVPGVSYKMDGKYYEEYVDKMDEAVNAAKNADVIVLCLGENTYTETPGNLNDLYISDLQTELAQKLAATGKKIILVLNEGRPRVISKFENKMAAVLQTYQPGNFGGDALADILYGDVNPSGRLPYTYPQYPNALFTYYHKPSESRSTTEGVYNYDADYNPQYVFGQGLSYTTFTYSDIKLSSKILKAGEKLTVSVDITNSGKVNGKESVLLYTSQLVSSPISPDAKRLRAFDKIDLKPGETKTVTFHISPEDLAVVMPDLKKVTEPGEFTIQIADKKINFNYSL